MKHAIIKSVVFLASLVAVEPARAMEPAPKTKVEHALIRAANRGQTEEVKGLLAKGANPNGYVIVNGTEVYALHGAAGGGHADIIQLLLQAGANVNIAKKKAMPAQYSPLHLQGETSLHTAAKWGENEAVQLLLASGANPAAKTKLGEAPIDLAIGKIIDALIEFKQNPNRQATELQKYTPIIKTLISHTTQEEIQPIIPHLIRLKNEGQLRRDLQGLIQHDSVQSVTREKLTKAKQYIADFFAEQELPSEDIPINENELQQAIEAGIIEALKKTPEAP